MLQPFDYVPLETYKGKPSTTQYKAECPAGKRWYVLYGVFNRAVSSTAIVYSYDSADKCIGFHGTYGATTGRTGYPLYSSVVPGEFWCLDAGEYISIEFGTAQNASSYASCVVLEVTL